MENISEKKGVYVILYRIANRIIRYIIFKRAEGWTGWELLKGGVEDSELDIETAKREVLEEAGINVEVHESKHSTAFYSEKEGKKIKHDMKVFFANINSENIQISKEHSEVKEVAFEEAMNLLTFENTKKLLSDVHEEVLEHEGL